MTRMMKDMNRNGQKGAALVVVLVLLLVGGIMITPLLNYMGTGIKAGIVHETKMDEVYAADAGIEDALWQIKKEQLDDLSTSLGWSPAYNAYDYYTSGWTYPLAEQVNGKADTVTVSNVWIPDISPKPDKVTANAIAGSDDLIVVGSAMDADTFRIRLTFDPDAGDLYVEKIGIWLPSGFDYVDNSSNLEVVGEDYYSDIDLTDPADYDSYNGGKKVIWSFSPAYPFAGDAFNDPFPNSENSPPFVNPAEDPQEAIITFDYVDTWGQGRTLESVTWVDLDDTILGATNIPYSWDSDIKIFQVSSVSGSTTVKSYAMRTEIRQLGTASAGDYYATGSSLMEDTDLNHISSHPTGDPYYIRDRWVDTDPAVWSPNNSSSSIIGAESTPGVGDGVPLDATVQLAYLYWTSWFHADDFVVQTRVPTGDSVDNLGTWTTTSGGYWNAVGEDDDGATPAPPPDDTNYITGQSLSGLSAYRLFTFDPFTMPAGAIVRNLTVHARVRDIDSGFGNQGNLRGYIKVNGNRYTSSTSHNTANSFTPYHDFTWTTNPYTDDPWTVNEINGIGTGALQEFGIYSTDLNPDVQASTVYATVNYNAADTSVFFKIDGQQVSFDASGDPQAGGELTIDAANFANDRIAVIPAASGGYAYSVRKDVTGLIKDADPLDLVPWIGAEDDDGEPGEDGDESDDVYYPGMATYVVGGVDGTLGDDNPSRTQLSHAGWSLVLIYASPSTKGHYLYLSDFFVNQSTNSLEFSHAADATDLDFDRDGQPGGLLTGFLVPQPVVGETVAARMTVFVGEGDGWILGESLAFNVPSEHWQGYDNPVTSVPNEYKLWDGVTTTQNTSASPQNIWNGMSPGFAADGVDVDTFYVTWASGMLSPGDTTAHVDIYTPRDGTSGGWNGDNWNLIYIILSFRSEVTFGGALSYLILD